MKRIRLLAAIILTIGMVACGNKESSYNYEDGDEFTAKTAEGVDMLFRIINVKDSTVQVGNGDSHLHPYFNDLVAINQQAKGTITIPNVVNGFRVVRIAEAAFFKCNIEKVIIPEGITSLEKDAFFNCTKLHDVLLPNSLKSIADGSFYCCPLTSIIIPKNVEYISSKAFDNVPLENIKVDNNNRKYDSRNNCNAIVQTSTNTLVKGCENTIIPNDVYCIGEYAFYKCKGLRSTNIGSGVKKIKDYAFAECKNLVNIHITDNVEIISETAFKYSAGVNSIIVDSNNKFYDSRKNCNAIIETSTNTLVRGCKKTVIPDDILKIGDWAFSSCIDMNSINIPSSVKEIGNHAFSSAILNTIKIPSSVKEIGDFAFSSSKLNKVELSEGLERVGNSAFEFCNLKSFIIPSSVVTIGNSALKNCDKLEEIIVNKDNPKFDSRNNCNAIIVTKINSLRAGCKKTLIPNDIEIIENGAFGIGIKRIMIPKNIKKIGEDAFYASIVTSLIEEPFNIDVIEHIIDTLFVPKGTKDKYANTEGWKTAKNIIELSD